METCFCPGLDQLREVVIFFREEVILEITKKTAKGKAELAISLGTNLLPFTIKSVVPCMHLLNCWKPFCPAALLGRNTELLSLSLSGLPVKLIRFFLPVAIISEDWH